MSPTGGTTVLVTGGENFGGLAAIRALAIAGYDTWAAVVADHSYAAFSRLSTGTVRVPDPASDPDGFVAALASAAERIGARVVLPGTDVTLAALAAGQDVFPSSIAVGACSPEQVEAATAKQSLSGLAEGAGFDLPPTGVFHRTDVEWATGVFPQVVKPLRSDVVGPDGTLMHVGAQRVKDARALRKAVDELGDDTWIVQPYLRGELVAVGGVAWNGALVSAVHQVSHRIWPPDCGGSSYASTVGRDSEREEKVARLLASLNWSGIFQVQLLRNGADEFLIDLNPRFYGTLALALAAGVNLPALWVELLLGGEPPAPGYRVGVRFRAHWKDARALAVIACRGDWLRAIGGLVPRTCTCHPVFEWSDPLPVLAGSIRVLRRLGRPGSRRFGVAA